MSVILDSPTYLPFDSYELCGESLKVALQEIGETEESKITGIDVLRKQLREIEGLCPLLEEDFLLRFLRFAKFDTSKAFDRILIYYDQQRQNHKQFKRFYRDFDCKLRRMKFNFCSPCRLENGSVLIIHKYGMIDFPEVDVEENYYLGVLVAERLLQNPVTQRCGLTLVHDYAGFSFKKILAHTPGKLRLLTKIFQNSMPLRIRGVHIVNASNGFSTLFKLSHPFLSKKLQERIFVHPSNDQWKSLHSVIPKHMLLEEYGGELKPCDFINLAQFGYEYEEQYLQQLRFGFVDTEDQQEMTYESSFQN